MVETPPPSLLLASHPLDGHSHGKESPVELADARCDAEYHKYCLSSSLYPPRSPQEVVVAVEEVGRRLMRRRRWRRRWWRWRRSPRLLHPQNWPSMAQICLNGVALHRLHTYHQVSMDLRTQLWNTPLHRIWHDHIHVIRESFYQSPQTMSIVLHRNNSDGNRPKTLAEVGLCNSLSAYVIKGKSRPSRYKYSLI